MTMDEPDTRAWLDRGLALPVAALLAWSVATAVLSTRFGASFAPEEEPIEAFVLLQVLGGCLWLWLLFVLRRRSPAHLLLLVVVVGLLLRVPLFFSTPILEDDYQRYLWDGAVTARGLDPYTHTPAEILAGGIQPEAEWASLVAEGGAVLARVNHPSLSTIYPPVAQGAFAIAHYIAPWKPIGLRVVWLCLDLMVCSLLILGLGRVPDRAWRLAIYWLNPLLLKEIYNSLHMELVLLVFATAALVWAGRRRIVLACASLGLAIGAKFWPILWVPLLLRFRGLRRRDALLGILVAGALAVVLVLPLLRALTGDASGLGAYARRWEMNDSAFLLLQALFETVTPAHAALATRATVALLLLGLLIGLLRRPIKNGSDLAGRALLVVAALFLLSPTQFPWYFLWCLPALALRPNFALLLLTVSLPLYYLRFRFVEHGLADWFDYGIVWLQFVPIWILLLREYRRAPPPTRGLQVAEVH